MSNEWRPSIGSFIFYVFIAWFGWVAAVGVKVFADVKREVIVDCDGEHARQDEVLALACNIYHESRSESQPGQWLVALATLNRVQARIYPNTFAEVVYEKRRDKNTRRMVAMFSWTLDKKDDFVYNKKMWLTALQIAARVVAHHLGNPGVEPIQDITFGCMWYHHISIKPRWMNSYHRTIRVQRHQCYAVNEKAYLKSLQEFLPDLEYQHK